MSSLRMPALYDMLMIESRSRHFPRSKGYNLTSGRKEKWHFHQCSENQSNDNNGCAFVNELHSSCAFSSTTVCTVPRHATYKKSFSLSLKSLHDVDCGHHLHLPCWWPSVCRRWASCLEYPTRLLTDFITDCSSLRTFKQSLKTYLFCLSFWAHNNTLFYDCVKRLSSSLCRYDALKLSFLHYITLMIKLERILMAAVYSGHQPHRRMAPDVTGYN